MASAASVSCGISQEVSFQNESVSLCLVINRRTRAMRVVDFRSGHNLHKGTFVLEVARREGVERVYTLVERDEVRTWQRLGFQREGSIPGFYKRSDAWILGTMVDAHPPATDPEKSGMRRAPGASSENGAAERAYQAARRLAKEREGCPQPVVRLHPARESDCRKAVAAALKFRRALTTFEPFGRDVERQHMVCTARGGFSLMASAEMQRCFNNAFLELLTGPRTEKESALTCAALGLLCDELFEREVVACFSLSPVDDSELAVAYVANGFRRTGVLHSHLVRDNERVDAFLWSRKLALPGDG